MSLPDEISSHPQVQPAMASEITEMMEILFESMSIQVGANPKLVLQGYLIALEGNPSWAIKKAVVAVLKAEIDGISRTFCPRAPELAEIVKGYVKQARDQIAMEYANRHRRLSAPKKQEQVISPEERERVKAKFEKLLNSFSKNEGEAVN